MEETKNEPPQRRRSKSVPILSQIDKVLDRRYSGVFLRGKEKDFNDEFGDLPNTPTLKTLANQARTRLASGGLLRDRKKKGTKTMVNKTKTQQYSSTDHEDEDKNNEDSTLDFTTRELNSFSTTPKLLKIGVSRHSMPAIYGEDPVADVHLQRTRSKSLPLVLASSQFSNSDALENKESNNTRAILKQCTVNTESTLNLKYGSMQGTSQGSLSLLECLQDDSIARGTAQLDISEVNEFTSSSVDLKAIASESLKDDKLVYRRRSLPFSLEKRLVLREPLQSRDEFSIDNHCISERSKINKRFRTRCLSVPPTTTSYLDGSINDHRKESEFSYSVRYDVQSKQMKHSHAPFSQEICSESSSSPLGIGVSAFERNKMAGTSCLTSFEGTPYHARIQKMERKQADSLPLFTGSTCLITEQNNLFASELEKGAEQQMRIEKEKQSDKNQNVKHSTKLARAKSCPLSIEVTPGNNISPPHTAAAIKKELQVAIDNFFNAEEMVCKDRRRSKSLPDFLQGSPVLNLPREDDHLGSETNIPQIIVADPNDANKTKDCENPPDSKEKTETGQNSINQETLEEFTDKLVPVSVRPRGYSMPSSFKMEKIPEESGEFEKFDLRYSDEERGYFFTTRDEEYDIDRPTDAHCRASIPDPEEHDQLDDYKNRLATFDNVVTEVLASVVQIDYLKSSSSLHRAVANGDLERLKVLLERGEDINAVDESGWPPLHTAVTSGNLDCGAWLVDAGADLLEYTNFVIDECMALNRFAYFQK